MNAETKARLIERVRTLEGLTNDERSALLELLRTEKAYGLVWENKPEDVEERLRDELPVLVEDEAKRIISDSPDAPNHVLIEGDNLEALTTLAYTHAGKIDVIYIDPPYNTGNKDFVYNDAFVDSEDAYRHSKWLSFMSKRLRIAKKLLSDRGVIFISIDDNEQAQLKLLCDEIFGYDNFTGNVIWEKTDSPRMDVKSFTVRHDYILVYQKAGFILNRIEPNDIPEHYNKIDEKGRRYYLKPLRLMGGHKSDSLYYGIEAPDGSIVYPTEKNGDKGCWRWSNNKYLEEIERIEWIKGKKGWSANFRIYADALKPVPVNTVWTFDRVGSTRTAKTELTNIIQQSIFSYPKPSSLISFITKISSENNSTILDFFAGSGTTLHAVMQLNAEDGGHRQCILVTNNENGICENVTYERNKRVINGYTKPNGDHVEGLHANNLRYYRTAYVGRNRSPQNLRRLVELSTDMLCIKEGLYTECHEFAGVKTRKQFFRYFEQDGKRMLIIYREEYVPNLVNLIDRLDLPDGERIKVYVFSPSEDPWAGEFEPVEDKITLCALPMAILNAYRRVLPKRREQVIYVDQETSKKPEVPASEPTLFDMNEEGGAQ